MAISVDILSAFVKVAKHASVSAAAAELGVGKSLVSKRIAQLEEALGATLFSRSTRRVALTPAGEAYLGHAQRALGELAEGGEHLLALCTELSGEIRLTASVSWGQRVLARRLPDFMRLHPGIDIKLLLADRIMDLAAERIDIALRWTHQPPTDLSVVPVSRVGWVIAASPAYLAAAGIPREPQDLQAHHCMCYWRERSDDSWVMSCADRREQVRVQGRYHVNNPESVAQAAFAGLGIALLPRYLCDDELADGRMVQVLPAWTPHTKFGSGIVAVAAPERLRLKRNQALLAFLRQRL